MATYQISFHALTPDGATAAPLAPDQPGMRFAMMPGDPAVILAEARHGGLVVCPQSPFGAAGQVITISGRIRASCAADASLRTFEVLDLDGIFVGLVAVDGQTWPPFDGTEPVPFAVKAVETAATSAALALPGLATPDTGQSSSGQSSSGQPSNGQPAKGKPRKSPFAFALGTRIDTPDGPRRVETLVPGDLVATLDNGSQPLRWVGRRLITPAEMALRDDLRPLRLEAGVLGAERALLISPRHKMLLNDWRAQVYFGEDQVLVPAQALINGSTVRQVLPLAGVTYVHLLFDRHEVIVSEGALSESFHPGETGLGALDPAQRHEIEALFPAQGPALALERRRAAFPMLRMAEARALRLPG